MRLKRRKSQARLSAAPEVEASDDEDDDNDENEDDDSKKDSSGAERESGEDSSSAASDATDVSDVRAKAGNRNRKPKNVKRKDTFATIIGGAAAGSDVDD
eukprot:GDKJ01062287.1.p1 GENE.GDKJ01062287.1~~GDKJ01062287.1.p1  ORF type:complete len:111 (+),score=11.69 GDKJ01062287.1:34-333(+)